MARKNRALEDGAAENAALELGGEAVGAPETVEDGTDEIVENISGSVQPTGDENGGDKAREEQLPDSPPLELANGREEEQSPDVNGETAGPDEAEDAVPEIRFLETVEEEQAVSDAEVMGAANGVGTREDADDSKGVSAPVELSGESARPPAPEESAPAPARKNSRSAFDQLDIRRLDRDLSASQRQEWEKIYASYRAKSILTGTVVGVDRNRFAITGQDGITEEKTVYTPVVIDYRVKVLIPETELWMPGEERSAFVVRGLLGTKIDYVITNIDREGEVAVASRRLALTKRRRMLSLMRSGNRPGDLIKCTVLSVAQHRCLVHCAGYDLILSQFDLSYPYIPDLRDSYHTGMELDAVIKEFSPGEHRLAISVKEVNPNPLEGAEKRHPQGCRRIATISSKYKGGIFCKLEDGLTCLALYSNDQLDTDFLVGDRVGVHIARINLEHGLFYGRIVAKL